jgi:hypothetical protein
MATSSIPGAIDYLVATATALPECVPPVMVFDGWPEARPETALVIGITSEDPTTDTEVTHGQLGAQTQWEEYVIPCQIWSGAAGDGAMRRARLAAFVILDALDTHLRTPPGRTLGGALNSGTAVLSNVRVRQTGDAANASAGRACWIMFDILCKSRSAA